MKVLSQAISLLSSNRPRERPSHLVQPPIPVFKVILQLSIARVVYNCLSNIL